MCEQCTQKREEAEAEERVTSLADFSTALLDAFTASNGAHQALLFVDKDDDVFEVDEIKYDAATKCIKVTLSGAYIDINAPSLRRKIAKVNGN